MVSLPARITGAVSIAAVAMTSAQASHRILLLMYVSEGSADGRGRWESATRSEFGSPFYHARAGLASMSCLAGCAWHDASFRLARSLQCDNRTKTLAGACHPHQPNENLRGGFGLRSDRGRWIQSRKSSPRRSQLGDAVSYTHLRAHETR